jgi:hypothetical protein
MTCVRIMRTKGCTPKNNACRSSSRDSPSTTRTAPCRAALGIFQTQPAPPPPPPSVPLQPVWAPHRTSFGGPLIDAETRKASRHRAWPVSWQSLMGFHETEFTQKSSECNGVLSTKSEGLQMSGFCVGLTCRRFGGVVLHVVRAENVQV